MSFRKLKRYDWPGSFKIQNLNFCICGTVKTYTILPTIEALLKERQIMEPETVLWSLLNIEIMFPVMTVDSLNKNVPCDELKMEADRNKK